MTTYINLSSHEAIALAQGRLAQLRRPAHMPLPCDLGGQAVGISPISYRDNGDACLNTGQVVPNVFGTIGDAIDVHESWCYVKQDGTIDYRTWGTPTTGYAYRADDPEKATRTNGFHCKPWMSPSTMPSDAVRYRLRISARWLELFEPRELNAYLEGWGDNVNPGCTDAFAAYLNTPYLSNDEVNCQLSKRRFRAYLHDWNRRFGVSCGTVPEPEQLHRAPLYWTWVCRFVRENVTDRSPSRVEANV